MIIGAQPFINEPHIGNVIINYQYALFPVLPGLGIKIMLYRL